MALVCPQDIDNLSASGSAGGYISGQIYYDAFSARFGHGGGGIVAMGKPASPHFLSNCCNTLSEASRDILIVRIALKGPVRTWLVIGSDAHIALSLH